MMPIYLDHQASTPMDEGAKAAMFDAFSTLCANPHSDDHAAGWAASDAVEDARGRVAAAVGAEADELVFTAGATEANNLALLGAAAAWGSRRGRVVVSAIEHKSVLAVAWALGRAGHEVVVVPVSREGEVEADAVARALQGGSPAIVSIGAVNNEIGSVQRLSDIATACRAAGALLHVDATQALSWRGVDVWRAGVDLASFSAHKMGGPKGIGALFVAAGARDRIEPVMFGGGQEGGLRPGTLPAPLCVGFGVACDALPDDAAVERWRGVTRRLLDGLRAAVPGLRLNGPPLERRHPGNLSLTFPGIEADALIARLQPRLFVARGSACTSGVPEPSHVLLAIGMDAIEAEATVRFSTGIGTTWAETDRAAALVAAALVPVAA